MARELTCFVLTGEGVDLPDALVTGLGEHAAIHTGTSSDDLVPLTDQVDAIIGWSGGNLRALLESLDPFPPRLQWVSQTGIGAEKTLFPRFVESDITLTNMRGISAYADAMAEFAFAAILLFGKKLLTIHDNQRKTHWERVRHSLLQDQTVGVVGLGMIGGAVARRALGFGMTVVATRRNPDRESAPGVQVLPASELDALLARSDYVVLAAPLTSETGHLIGAREIALMKPGAVIVNVARGAMIDDAALVAALESGHLGGAALDVFTEEPLPAESPLWTAPNLFVSPHMSAFAEYDTSPMIDAVVANMRRFRNGEPLEQVVDKRLGY
ncbi:MAG: D-2-hydroxyacid dehydrogenase [Thermomicrobiales bacterium]|nr:D-2-hydroxyacid dehydrogenase [Thermomicrobiales bacterium]